ncbi:hypothetical protein OH77DRAFT_1425874 [Trametes cingulata]|nr:hypothetical protein OH77DRAFT_1425874 [Trametes cingulata]
MADALVQHPPAMKVGGRRLSVTSRPKPVVAPAEARRPSPDPDTPTDYPRPAPPGEQQQQQRREEEDVPKRKQGSGGDEHERRMQESLYRKAEHNRPTKEKSGPRMSGAGAKINQPAGKSLSM